jgi:MFS family permease
MGCSDRQHVLATEWIPHRWLSFLTIIIPGMIAGSFGLATSPSQLAVMRCLMGVFGLGGMQAIILGEITDSESSSQGQLPVPCIIPSTDTSAFGWLTIAGSIGVMSGAALSGYLAEPAGRVPIFGDIELFKQKPYLLPGLTISLVAFFAASAVFFTVPEVGVERVWSDKANQIDQCCPSGRDRRR